MRSIVLMSEVVALVAAASLYASCASQQVTSQEAPPPLDPSRDITDLGGQMREATVGCGTDPEVVYRYYARVIGADANIGDFCVGEGLEDFFVHQPTEAMFGFCPGESCGVATTARRGPVEHAMLQAIVSLEHGRSLRLKTGTKSDSVVSSHHDVTVQQGTVKFRLAEGIECVSELRMFAEHTFRSSLAEAERLITADRAKSSEVKYVYDGGNTVSSGDVYVLQKKVGDRHELLVMVGSQFEGRTDAETFVETSKCWSTAGPISAWRSPFYGIRAEKQSTEEWRIMAFERGK